MRSYDIQSMTIEIKRQTIAGMDMPQIVKPSATVLLKKSTGEIKSRHFLRRLLIKSRTASRRSLERVLKSNPRGKKNLKTSLTFSFEPLCQGE